MTSPNLLLRHGPFLGASLLSLALVRPAIGQEDAAQTAEVESARQRATPEKDVPKVRAHQVIPEGGGFAGFGVHFTDGALKLIRCDATCGLGEVEKTIELPAEATRLPRTVERIEARSGARALFVRYGRKNDYYALVLMGGPQRGNDPGEPRLLLKGWVGPESPGRTDMVIGSSDRGKRILLASSPSPAVCGRQVPSVTRVLDPDVGRFRNVKLPVLSGEVRDRAAPLEVLDEPDLQGKLLVPLEEKSERSAAEPFDGDLKSPWQGGYEFAEFERPEGSGGERLFLQLSAPLTETKELHLATSETVYRVELPPGPSTLRAVALPPRSADGCVAVVQPQAPVSISELMAAVDWQHGNGTKSLVAQLEQSDPGPAMGALRLRGKEGASTIGAHFPLMSPMARARGLELASAWGVEKGAPVFVAAVEFGTEEQRTTAQEELRKRPDHASTVLRQRLPKASPGGKMRLVDALASIAPADAVQAIVPLLNTDSGAERLHFRRALAALASSKQGGPVVQGTIERIGGDESGLDANVEVEILRAAGPKLKEWHKSTLPALERLSDGASFERAYRLLPHVLGLASKSKALQEAFSAWLVGKKPQGASEMQRAALSVRALEVLSEGSSSTSGYGPEVAELLASDNMRVRRAALMVLRSDEIEAPRREVLRLLARDDWPEVRAAAAEATTSLESEGKSEDLERTIARRLRKDPHPTVRAAVARSLAKRSGEHSRRALRRAFEKDESYEVRAEAALALGDLCDSGSVAPLTASVRELGRGPVGDGPIMVGLAAVTALAAIAPEDLQQRLEPARGASVSAVLKNQVEQRVLAVEEGRRAGRIPTCASGK